MSKRFALANRTGQTFTNPKTSAEASAEIKRLKGARPSSRVEVRIERKQIAESIDYEDVLPPPIELPPRAEQGGYVRPPLESQTFVPARF
jgi:hypothetical protein